jgi:cyclopropane-fatty-acyl-phospholipid synthase
MNASSSRVGPSSDLASIFPRLSAERLVVAAFARAGITVNGNALYDIRVSNPTFYRRMALNPAYELGSTYVDGLWECDAIDELMARLLDAGVGQSFERGWQHAARSLIAKARNLQSRIRASIIADHYDLGDELFTAMLDPSMAYTCAVWQDGATTLADAQARKMAIVCEQLALAPGDRFLDVGCGWGGLLDFAARRHGVRATGITISKNQHAFARARLADLEHAKVELMDYRDLVVHGDGRPRFDKIASIEMVEAVGPKNYATFMSGMHELLEPGGLFLLQSFISHRSVHVCNEWFDRHIFPNGVSPSLALLARASESTFGAPTSIRDIGRDYDPTLMAWDANFDAHWPSLTKHGYDERFRRMWHFYLTSLAGVFRAKHLRCFQILFEKPSHRRGT